MKQLFLLISLFLTVSITAQNSERIFKSAQIEGLYVKIQVNDVNNANNNTASNTANNKNQFFLSRFSTSAGVFAGNNSTQIVREGCLCGLTTQQIDSITR